MSRCLLISVPEEHSDDVVRALQDECGVQNVVRTTQEGVATVRCCVCASAAGYVVHHLDKIGVGVAYGEVAMLTVPVLLPSKRNPRLREAVREVTQSLLPSQRLCVEEVNASVKSGAVFSFEYFALIICAAIIAAVGLATNNAVMIVASMLVSPLMGPILGFTFAVKIGDWRLFRQAVVVEVLGMILTFLIGLIGGFFCSLSDTVPSQWDWPTNEMASRGDYATLITGAVYAVPSGVAVVLANVNPNSGALVGVAIAASLLPPITNSGLCFGFAAVSSYGDSHEYSRIAGYSLLLFAINVVLISSCALLTFYLKGVDTMTRPQLSTYKKLPLVPVPVPLDPRTSHDGDGMNLTRDDTGSSEAARKWQGAVEKVVCHDSVGRSLCRAVVTARLDEDDDEDKGTAAL